MNTFFTKIIMLSAFTLISGQMELLSDDRTLPADLQVVMKKTDMELGYEACMSEYRTCLSVQRIRKNYDYRICALEKTSTKKATFSSLCELIYENCKQTETTEKPHPKAVAGWGFFHDGPCAVEFISPKR